MRKYRYLLASLAVTSAIVTWVVAQGRTTTLTAEQEAKTIIDDYAVALNQKKESVIEAYFAEGIDHIDNEGVATTGKANVMAMLKPVLEKDAEFSIQLSVTSAKRVGNDVILIDGTSEIKIKGESDKGRFESIWQRNGNRWQLNRVREIAEPETESDSNEAVLKELAWMVGEWTAVSGDYQLTMTAKWGANKNFLLSEHTVTQMGKPVVTITKLIGWDAVNNQIRTWVFDSDGGFGGSMVSRTGNTWVEQFESQTRSGSSTTAFLTMRMATENTFEWQSTDRNLDGTALPDLKVTYTRKK